MKILLSFLLLLSFNVLALDNFDKVIYGKDNRIDTFASNNTLYAQLANASMAIIPNANLNLNGDFYTVEGESLLTAMNLCPSERFIGQTSSAICSAVLVGPNLVATAGHCITSLTDCSNNKFVFGYVATSDAQSIDKVPAKDVYSCTKILSREQGGASKADYALLQLDRRVTDRLSVKFRRTGKIADRTDLVMIGHPTGLPQKIADGAKVRNNNLGAYFVSNTDSYGGNSGSPVFDAKTGLLEGLLVRGDQDYAFDSANGCYVSKVCSDIGCRGEDITRITIVKQMPR